MFTCFVFSPLSSLLAYTLVFLCLIAKSCQLIEICPLPCWPTILLYLLFVWSNLELLSLTITLISDFRHKTPAGGFLHIVWVLFITGYCAKSRLVLGNFFSWNLLNRYLDSFMPPRGSSNKLHLSERSSHKEKWWIVGREMLKTVLERAVKQSQWWNKPPYFWHGHIVWGGSECLEKGGLASYSGYRKITDLFRDWE